MHFLFILLLVPLSLGAQVPRIGVIDYYGLRKTPAEKLRKAIGIAEGDPLPPSKLNIEKRIEALSGIVQAKLEAVCCEGGKAILYVGVEEKGAPHFDFHSVPASADILPDDIVTTYRNFLTALRVAGQKGDIAEDLTNGYSLMANAECRELQEKLLHAATPNLVILRKVLRNSEDPEQRAVAAYVLGYAPKKPEIIDDLQWAMQDADGSVRANAMSSLTSVTVLATLHPDLGIRISPTWFIEMLNSIEWTDRRRAALALVNLTEKRDPGVLAELRQRSLASLVEMARWKSLAHALPGYILLGRVAGRPEKTIQDTWSRGERETNIASMVAELTKRKK